MIVKNESQIIERCLQSTLGVVDCYLICDTGSTDSTPEIISLFFAKHDQPGELIKTKFVDFSQARNEALHAARDSNLKFDYIMFADADMELRVDYEDWRHELTGPAHYILQRTSSGLEYPNVRVVRRSLPCIYRGVTHEYLDLFGIEPLPLTGLRFIDHAIGANRKDKFTRDESLLLKGVEREPGNSRYVFYLANTYFDNQRYDDALHWYSKRIEMAGYLDEVFISRYAIGRIHLYRNRIGEFTRNMLELYNDFPNRAEPLHALAQHALQSKQFQLAHTIARIGQEIPKPNSGLFVETSIYDWRLADIDSVALYWINKPEEALNLANSIVGMVPSDQISRIRQNIIFCEVAIGSKK